MLWLIMHTGACTQRLKAPSMFLHLMDPAFFVQIALFETVLSMFGLCLSLIAPTWCKLERRGEFPGRAGRNKAGGPWTSLSPLCLFSASPILPACETPSMVTCVFVVLAGARALQFAAYCRFHLGLILSYYTYCLALTLLPGTVIHCFQYSNGIAWVCHH